MGCAGCRRQRPAEQHRTSSSQQATASPAWARRAPPSCARCSSVGSRPWCSQNDDEIFDLGTYESQQGGYLPTANTQGGYMAQGGYMDAQPQGSNGYQQ